MKKLVFVLLAFGSLSAFATIDCENALNDLVQHSDYIGKIKTYIARNNEKPLVNKEEIEAHKILVEAVAKSPGTTEKLKEVVRKECKATEEKEA
jgi:predicted P-loop ATPase/GTPase